MQYGKYNKFYDSLIMFLKKKKGLNGDDVNKSK